ncbi:MAG TPA: acyl-CoA thioesterase [Noviherbaspirillum sp.]
MNDKRSDQDQHNERADNRSITLRFLAQPTDVNFGGKVHGGAVMKWIDQAGYACAVGWSGYYCVTAYIGGIRFYKPIFIGQIVEVKAAVIYTGSSSMHIGIEVSATDARTGTRKKTAQCVVVFVAVDEGGDKVRVPRWEPVEPADVALHQYALRTLQSRSADSEEFVLP